MSQRTRRQFLEDSMFAAAAAVASSTSRTICADDKQHQSSSPNERLWVAVAGVRGRGGSHLGSFAGRKDTHVAYICDADREVASKRAKEVARRQGGRQPRVVEDLREVLDDNSVDIVSIATPNHQHALQAIWSIQAGKDVYVEKPVGHNVSEGRRIVEAARKYRRICQTGTQSRSNPGMVQAMKYVHDGGIGQVALARGLCYKPRQSIGAQGSYAPPPHVNYDLWLGPAPLSPVSRPRFHYDWHWQWEYGNGDLGNQGIHQLDLARWGLDVDSLPLDVLSYGGRFGYQDAGETANTQVVIHNYGEKSLVFEVRGLETTNYRDAKIGVIFEGSEGYVVMTSYYSGAAFDRDGVMIQQFNARGNHFENFLKGVRSRNLHDLNADIEQGHLSSALCHLGNISYRLGTLVSANEIEKQVAKLGTAAETLETLQRTVAHLTDNGVDLGASGMIVGPHLRLEPKLEKFAGSDAANAMLTRQYREPYVVPEEGKV